MAGHGTGSARDEVSCFVISSWLGTIPRLRHYQLAAPLSLCVCGWVRVRFWTVGRMP